MSNAQLATYATKKKRISVSNKEVYGYMKTFRSGSLEPQATAEQLINFISGELRVTPVQGKRISQPVYRALSEGASEGILADDEMVTNQETGAPNTLYRLLLVPRAPKEKDTWKQRALKAEVRIKELEGARDFLAEQNQRLVERNESLLEAIYQDT